MSLFVIEERSVKPASGKRYKVNLKGAFTALALSYKIIYMQKYTNRFLVPASFMAGSFLCLLLTLLLTNPLQNLVYIIVFFVALFIFLISFGHLLIYIRTNNISTKSRYRVFIFSFLFVAILMFRSAQSLNLSDLFILVLICFGLIFYSSKRSS
jgi:hypothetical protein